MQNGMIEWHSHISSPPERRRKLEGRMEPDARPESDGAPSWRAGMSPSSSLKFVLHVQRDVTTVAMQSIDTGSGCWQGAPSLPGAQQSATVGCAGRTHSRQNVMPIAYELANTEGSRGLWEKEGRRKGAGREAGAGQVADARTPRRTKSGKCTNTTSTTLIWALTTDGLSSTDCKTRNTQPSARFTQVVLAHHPIYTHTMLAHTHKHTCMHFYMRYILKASMLKAYMEHTTLCRVYLCVRTHI